MKNILLATSECVPFVKTGGLADVAGSLPKYFDRRKYDVRVIMPNYEMIPEQYKEKMELIDSFYTGWNFEDRYVGLYKLEMDRVIYYFIDNPEFYKGKTPYSDSVAEDVEKFSFFSRQVLSVLKHVKAGGNVPETYQDAVGLGLNLRFVTPERWEAVKILANVLAWTKPKHRKPGAGARKRRADEHWRRQDGDKADQEGPGGSADSI